MNWRTITLIFAAALILVTVATVVLVDELRGDRQSAIAAQMAAEADLREAEASERAWSEAAGETVGTNRPQECAGDVAHVADEVEKIGYLLTVGQDLEGRKRLRRLADTIETITTEDCALT